MSPVAVDTCETSLVLEQITLDVSTMGPAETRAPSPRRYARGRRWWRRSGDAHVAASHGDVRLCYQQEEPSGAVAWEEPAQDGALDRERSLVVQMPPKRSWRVAARLISWSRPVPNPILPRDE
jgi:hypothetical protein